MKNKRTTKIIAGVLVTASIMAMNPVGASAAWEKNNKGWWYKEGTSQATSWREIDGKWYSFYSNGYMAQNCWIGKYYLSSDGSWLNKDITQNQAQQMVEALRNTKYFTNDVEFEYSPYENYMSGSNRDNYYIFGISYGGDSSDSNVCIRKDNGQAYICVPEQYRERIYSIEDFYNMLCCIHC